MLHSQSLRTTPAQSWIICKQDGTVVTANCDCKAGLGSICTHMAAILHYMSIATKIREAKTVTQEPAYWLLPSAVRNAPPAEAAEIDFSSAKRKRCKLDNAISSLENTSPLMSSTPLQHLPPIARRRAPAPTEQEQQDFLRELAAVSPRSAILSITAPFSDAFVPKAAQQNFPSPLTDLLNEKCLAMARDELLQHCQIVKVTMTAAEAKAVESATRDQAKSKVWFRYRARRVTASKMKAVCRTSLDKPAPSLIRSICHPEEVRFTSAATTWGCDHEAIALEQYCVEMTTQHEGFTIKSCGLLINPKFPEIGASPDAIVSCQCCGSGLVEIKCPYCVKEPEDHSCIDSNLNQLKKDHAYHYQVQCQLAVSESAYCDFVLWVNGVLHRQRVLPDKEFWNAAHGKASDFFRQVLLLELCGRYFTRRDKT